MSVCVGVCVWIGESVEGREVKGGDGIVVPAGARHNLTNTGDTSLRLYTIYGPPNHVDKLVEVTKADAEASREVFDGVASE